MMYQLPLLDLTGNFPVKCLMNSLNYSIRLRIEWSTIIFLYAIVIY
jgi:hypothetical protein